MFILAELGDYDPVQHTPELVSEFRFVPDQTEEMEIDILNFYKTCKYVQCILKHLNSCLVKQIVLKHVLLFSYFETDTKIINMKFKKIKYIIKFASKYIS